MRTVDAALTAALSSGNPTPYLKAYVGYSNGTLKNSHTNVVSYKLTGTTLEFVIPSDQNFASDQESIWLERGLTIAGTTYTVTTGRFFITDEEYLPNGWTRYKGAIFPHKYYSDAGDDTYENVIQAFCTEWGKSATFKDDTEDWLDYQFLPEGQQIIVNSAIRFLNQLQQKRLISCCDNGGEEVRFYSADVLGTADVTIPLKDQFDIWTTKTRRRQYVWRDEAQTVHYDGTATDPLHNLGYLESTDDPPARNTQTFEAQAYIRPDLRLQDGDVVKFTFDGGTKSITVFGTIIEEYDRHSTTLPRWKMLVQANPIYHATEGGAMPSTIERVSNYTPLNTSSFDDLLDAQDNNLQAAMETIDEHHPGGYVRELLGADRTYYVRYNVGTCTISNASPAVVTANGHGLLNNDPVVFQTTGGLPTGLVLGTVYYVVNKTANTFEVSDTAGGASLNTSSAGSGTHSVATGKDTNTGKTTGRAGALLTIQKAVDLAAALDSVIYDVTIQLAPSYYSIGALVECKTMLGAGEITILGDASTPTNVRLNSSGAGASIFEGASCYTLYNLNGMHWTSSGSGTRRGIYANGFAQFTFKNIVFGTGLTRHLDARSFAKITVLGNYEIAVGGTHHYTASALGIITYGGSFTITVTGTPAFSTAFAYASSGQVNSVGMTFSGSATGPRYLSELNAVINTGGGGANYFPGNSAGSTATGGQYA